MPVKVKENYYYHCSGPCLDTMTVRQALKIIREMFDYGEFGNMGELLCRLDDDTTLEVELLPAYGGGHLMSSQRIVRRGPYGQHIRTYRLEV